MPWPTLINPIRLVRALLVVSLLVPAGQDDGATGMGVRAAMSKEKKRELRELVRKTFYHGFDNYMKHAFPQDELRPLSCSGLGHDRVNLQNYDHNDVMGDYLLTLIDTLDTLIVLNDHARFTSSVRLVISHLPSFDLDSRVQVFEVTIRVLGGLLSAHLFAEGHGARLTGEGWNGVKGYRGELLTLAEDLGRRLLPAFHASPTGLPYARVNLRTGMMQGETAETCTAAAGSLLLEFTLLSRLTGDPVFEQVARKSFFALWHRRSPLGLFGNTINLQNGVWSYGVSSVGAGIDSVYEYMAKSAIMLGEDEYWRVWDEAYGSVMRYIRGPEGFWYRSVNMATGAVASTNIDSLSAFWPGLQILVGDVESAIQSHLVFANLWRRHGGMPEVFDIQRQQAITLGYPLRPEFVESNYFLYQATKDPFYQEVGEKIAWDLVNRTWVDCGLAVIKNLNTGELEDRMHSFMLSETLKYLYLTFDEDNPLNHDDSPFVYSTEGHILFLPDPPVIRRRPGHSSAEASTCHIFDPMTNPTKYPNPLKLTTESRSDAEYARDVTKVPADARTMIERGIWSVEGRSEVPVAEDFMIELIFGAADAALEEHPGRDKVTPTKQGVMIRDIKQLRMAIRKRADNQGFNVVKVASYRIPSGSFVYISDPQAVAALTQEPDARASGIRATLGSIRLDLPVLRAAFGPDVLAPSTSTFALKGPLLPLKRPPHIDAFACSSLTPQSVGGAVLLVRRGLCTFRDKAARAAEAGAMGVIVSNDEDGMLVPTSDAEPDDARQPLVPLLLAANSTGVRLERLLDAAEVAARNQSAANTLEVQVQVIQPPPEQGVVEINGYRLMNIILVR